MKIFGAVVLRLSILRNIIQQNLNSNGSFEVLCDQENLRQF